MDERRVFVATPPGPLRERIKESLIRHGMVIIGEAGDGLSTLRSLHSVHPDVVIIEHQLSGLDGIELAKLCQEERLGAAVLLTTYSQLNLVQKAMENWFFEPLLRPIREESLLAAVLTAHTHYVRESKLTQEVMALKEALERRKLIDKAKGKLMDKMKVSEEEAHRILQRYAMNHRLSAKEAAAKILRGFV
ncbi:ANTAR domain-containing response regulator [Heliophilum fasciatum]|uniref:Stage 0 sporulation protein A homolog n=1 Tax=Heliophilum fasciatum TaxID=35700 RepID=A0A4R2RMN6_9FIRM|nr:ANTAR domain-containing protein [Heliophilum fasciatum]MCW2279152.1 response regulator NasT [Heliophilum fasciatum]TCP61011.1 response regulator receiver and ANTAR domain protein [Heliophilum fasciatum]